MCHYPNELDRFNVTPAQKALFSQVSSTKRGCRNFADICRYLGPWLGPPSRRFAIGAAGTQTFHHAIDEASPPGHMVH